MGATAGGRALSAREEELLGLLSGFPYGDSGSDRELSFSDLLVDASCAASARPSGAAADDHAPAPREEETDNRTKLSPGKPQDAAASTKQQATSAARERRQRRQRSGGGSRGSCGGSGDGVLLNFYVPGLRLTRSMTAPRPGRAALQPVTATGHPTPAKPAAVASAGKARTQAPLGIGCWPALWSRGRDRRGTTKACS